MPEGRFYEDYIEENKKKDKARKAKKKLNKRLILVFLIFILIIYLVVLNIQNRTKTKEEMPMVQSSRSIEGFEEKTLEDGTKIKIERITFAKDEAIVYIKKETTTGEKKQLEIFVQNVKDTDNELKIDEDSLSIKINLEDRTIEEVQK